MIIVDSIYFCLLVQAYWIETRMQPCLFCKLIDSRLLSHCLMAQTRSHAAVELSRETPEGISSSRRVFVAILWCQDVQPCREFSFFASYSINCGKHFYRNFGYACYMYSIIQKHFEISKRHLLVGHAKVTKERIRVQHNFVDIKYF